MSAITRARAWAARQDWNPVRRTRTWWEASEWAGMTRREIGWHIAGWLLGLVAVVVVGTLYAGLVALWPRATGFLTFAAIYGGLWASLGYWYGTQVIGALRERLKYAEQRWEALTNSHAADLLAEVGPITGPTTVVELFDQDAPTAGEVPA